MKKLLFLAIVALLWSCNSNDKFKVEGTIADAAGKTLYFEHIGLMKTHTIDSTKLNDKGSFKFKSPRPEYPDFYRLRIGTQTIDFAVDSCELIHISAKIDSFSTGYDITGSQNSKDIQTLRKSIWNIQRKVNGINSEMTSEQRNTLVTEITNDIEQHKTLARKLILRNPRSTAAYFAIYQKINNSYIFSPYAKEDKPFCAAVATSYNAFMPEYERTKNLYNLVMDAIKTERSQVANQQWKNIIENASTGYIDIVLNDRNDQVRKLSELEGKLVLIDFSAYEMKNSVQYTFELRELYNKYHSRGFEIYQVSLDRSILLWKESTANLPWVCVREGNTNHTSIASTYNVQQLPTMFLLSKKGVIMGRDYDFKTLEEVISKNL